MPEPTAKKGHNIVATCCILFIGSMLGLSYASVPFYSWFCKTTGFGGTPVIAAVAPQARGRLITIRFDSNISSDLPWTFKPVKSEMKVALGAIAEAEYLVENQSDKTTSGSATYNVVPPQSGGYFNKLECFCFTTQTLQAHETRKMLVRFFVDPDMINDKNVATLDTITLSYTFYPQNNPAKLSQAAGTAAPKLR